VYQFYYEILYTQNLPLQNTEIRL